MLYTAFILSILSIVSSLFLFLLLVVCVSRLHRNTKALASFSEELHKYITLLADTNASSNKSILDFLKIVRDCSVSDLDRIEKLEFAFAAFLIKDAGINKVSDDYGSIINDDEKDSDIQ